MDHYRPTMNLTHIAFSVLSFSTLALAQTFTVRGEVESNDGQRIRMESTRVLLESSAVNLVALEDTGYYRFRVEDVGTPGQPRLRVLSAERDRDRFGFERLAIGQSTFFEVAGTPGARGFVFLDTFAATGVTVVPGIGGWLLSANALPVGSTAIRPDGEGTLRLDVPDSAALLGVRFTGQAAVVDGDRVVFTNPGAQTVRDIR